MLGRLAQEGDRILVGARRGLSLRRQDEIDLAQRTALPAQCQSVGPADIAGPAARLIGNAGPRWLHAASLVVSATTIGATLYDKLGFNLIRDIAPVAGISLHAPRYGSQSINSSQERPRVHCLRQSQSAQTQHGVCEQRVHPASCGRVVQGPRGHLRTARGRCGSLFIAVDLHHLLLAGLPAHSLTGPSQTRPGGHRVGPLFGVLLR
jgi:hypothetical protein